MDLKRNQLRRGSWAASRHYSSRLFRAEQSKPIVAGHLLNIMTAPLLFQLNRDQVKTMKPDDNHSPDFRPQFTSVVISLTCLPLLYNSPLMHSIVRQGLLSSK
jgi:hypothetical protein